MSAVDPGLLVALSAIEPYLDQVVLAGGWVPYFYELLYDATRAGRAPRTRDVDVAVGRSIRVRDSSIDQLLVAAGFECRFHSLSSPPVTKYVAERSGADVEVEFITNARGSSEGVVLVQPDLTAQRLHYVGLLLENPWDIDMTALTGGEVDFTVRIPKPGAFVLHKGLVFKRRADRLKREKDLYYIFFVLESFPDWHRTIASEFGRLAEQHRAWFARSVRNLESLFGRPEGPGVDALLNQRPPTAHAELNDDQFRQHAFGVMHGLIQMMQHAAAGSGR